MTKLKLKENTKNAAAVFYSSASTLQSHWNGVNGKDAMDVVDEIRTVVVAGVPDILPSDRMADKLVIHFQSLRSNGGDVQNVLYPTISKGVAFVTFDNIADAERVIKKEQSMRDEEFPKDYTLTVFKFTTDH
ncbi:RNA-binding protein 43-like isoform X2 [Osmerus eperlanus]|uniref:RNA-binding protein 43-like isoform X2 n=1 Tax=Osmerus eperlanus TaxID=29151 RepID=UPI002E0ED9F6